MISLCLALSSQQVWDRSEDNDAAANLPQSYRRTADRFLNISLCVSLQMLRGKITSLNCPAVKNLWYVLDSVKSQHKTDK